MTGLHALDQHRDATPLQALDDVPQHPRPRRVDEFELTHPQDHDRYVVEGADLLEDAVRGREEERPVEAEHGDALVAGLRVAADGLTVHGRGAGQAPQRDDAGEDHAERRIARTVPACTIRTAVTMRTPARAARGMVATGPDAASTTTSRTTA